MIGLILGANTASYQLIFIISIMIILGLFSGRYFEHKKIPNLVAYILIGIIFGGILVFIGLEEIVGAFEVIVNIAIGFIAFSIGLEVDFKKFKSRRKEVMIITLFQGMFAFIFTFFGLLVLKLPIHIALVIGSLAIATEPGPILLITKKLKCKGPVCDTLVPLHGLEDVITIMMFGMAISYAVSVEKNQTFTLSDIFWGPIAELIFSILIAFVIGYIFVRIIRFLKYEDKEKDLVILVSAFVAIMAAISISHLGFELFHHHIHLSPILVPMGVGITFSILSTHLAKHETERVMDGFSGPLHIAFFTVLGAEIVLIVFYSINVSELLNMIGIAVVYVIFRMIGKITGSYIGGTVAKSDRNVAKYIGFCLLPQAQAAIGLALYAHSKLNFTIYGTLLLIVIMISSIINEVFGPLGVRYSLIKSNEASLDALHSNLNHLDESKH